MKLINFCQNLEVVPLFGDMQIAPFNYIKRSKHYDPSKSVTSLVINTQTSSMETATRVCAAFMFIKTCNL